MLMKICRKENTCILLVGMQTGTTTMENSIEVPWKTKNRTTIWSSNFTPGYISEKNKKHEFKKIHASPMFIAA